MLIPSYRGSLQPFRSLLALRVYITAKFALVDYFLQIPFISFSIRIEVSLTNFPLLFSCGLLQFLLICRRQSHLPVAPLVTIAAIDFPLLQHEGRDMQLEPSY